ncbi:MAG: hypothetical protein MZU91_02730 [Desulfosudis oleivorans]|nr:hypothetical protein [Desulfosudis oleivorans]
MWWTSTTSSTSMRSSYRNKTLETIKEIEGKQDELKTLKYQLFKAKSNAQKEKIKTQHGQGEPRDRAPDPRHPFPARADRPLREQAQGAQDGCSKPRKTPCRYASSGSAGPSTRSRRSTR